MNHAVRGHHVGCHDLGVVDFDAVAGVDREAVAAPVLSPRVVLGFEAEARGRRTADVIAELLDAVAVPT